MNENIHVRFHLHFDDHLTLIRFQIMYHTTCMVMFITPGLSVDKVRRDVVLQL